VAPAPVTTVAPSPVTVVAPSGSSSSAVPPAADQDTAPTEYRGSPDDDVDMSPEERAISDFLRKDGVYVALGIVAVFVCSMALSRTPE
jgi:hypothetical protein